MHNIIQEHTQEAEDTILVNNKEEERIDKVSLSSRLYNDSCFYGDSTVLPAFPVALSGFV